MEAGYVLQTAACPEVADVNSYLTYPVLYEKVTDSFLHGRTTTTTFKTTTDCVILVSWCFEPSQPQRVISGPTTNLGLSPSYL